MGLNARNVAKWEGTSRTHTEKSVFLCVLPDVSSKIGTLVGMVYDNLLNLRGNNMSSQTPIKGFYVTKDFEKAYRMLARMGRSLSSVEPKRGS
jgi:hypothetical protein